MLMTMPITTERTDNLRKEPIMDAMVVTVN